MLKIIPITDLQRQENQANKERATDWLKSYSGLSSFVNSVKQYFIDKNDLTINQINAVLTVMTQDDQKKAGEQIPMVASPYKRESAFAKGDVITVNRVMAAKVGILAGFGKKFHNVQILEVLSEGFGWIEARVETCYKKTSFCGCCGLSLTDPQSIAAGIGPVCARHYKISHGSKSLEELDKLLGRKEISKIRIWKSAIKNHHKATNEAA